MFFLFHDLLAMTCIIGRPWPLSRRRFTCSCRLLFSFFLDCLRVPVCLISSFHPTLRVYHFVIRDANIMLLHAFGSDQFGA